MPKVVSNRERFAELLGKSDECRVVRRGDRVKLKVRAGRFLHTFETSADDADSLLKSSKAKALEY